jgi:hypothetical protein
MLMDQTFAQIHILISVKKKIYLFFFPLNQTQLKGSGVYSLFNFQIY